MELGLQGKVAIVTGATAGIGLETARVLRAEGAKVAICARDAARVEATAADLGGDVLGLVADIAIPEQLEQLVTATVERFGGVDILVNNAGGGARSFSLDVTDEAWARDLDLKLLAHIRLARLVAPIMRERGGGAVVNVANIHARHPGAASVPTSASRAAGLAFAKALSRDLGPDNIRVNTVCIGVVKSASHDRRWRAAEPSVEREAYYLELARSRDVPLGRTGETEEAANVIAFLASPAAGYVSGTALAIDGGASYVF